MNEPAGNQRQRLFLSFVRHCQWDQLLEAVGQGVSRDQRDLAVSRAVQHGQWWLVSHLVQLGVSQQQRDGAAMAAARHQQWDCLHHLLSARITTDSRDDVLREAARQSQWALLTPLIPLGLKPESRELVVTKAVQDEQWDAVVDVLKLGLERNLVTQICNEIINKQQWKYVPSVMKLVNETHMMDFVLQAAISSCQWECVMQLIQIGLTPAQQQLVCHKALEFNRFDCAVELLRQGICYESACRIVWEALEWNQWHGLIDLLKESGICTAVRDAILKTAKQCMVDYIATDTANVYEYMKLLEASRPTETELRNVIKEALYDLSLVQIFLQALTVFKSARRLIQQTVLTIKMLSTNVIFLHNLLWDQDPDLAFHLYVGQHMWECVVGIYEDPRLTARARHFALTQAINRQAWTAVQRMTAMKVTSDRDRRHAFLQTSRLGEWHTALEISKQGVPLDWSDKVFALRMWASLGLSECVSRVFETWGYRQKLVNCVLQESIIAEQREVFVNVCSELDAEDVNPAFVFRTALAHNKGFFILEFCQCMEDIDILKMAIDFALKEENWDLVKDLIKNIMQITDSWKSDYAEVSLGGLLLMCIKSIVQFQEAWPTVVPEVNTLCKQYFLDCEEDDYFENILHEFESVCEEGTQLLEFCLEVPHDHVALLLSVLSENECNVQRALRTVQQECLSSSVSQTLFLIAASIKDWGSSTLLLQNISKEQAVELVVCEYMDGDDSDEFALKCREKGLFKWATYIAMWTGDWDGARDYLEHCADINTVDKVIEEAAKEDEWEIVLSHLSRCSQDQSLLCRILCSAVSSGHSECCEMLIVKVNPLLGIGGHPRPLIYRAVTSSGDREDMVQLCIKAGLSTHREQWSHDNWRGHLSPMSRVLHNGQLPLVKLLYRAGACSNGELQEYKNKGSLRDQFTHQKRQDIMEYMDFMASTPRSLQDLCRQKVSHCIGCQPSRSERVSSLGLSHVVCDLINFADVLSS